MDGFRTQPLPWRKRALRRHRVGKPPCQAQHDQYQDEDSKGDMKCHDGRFHVAMKVRQQPADRVLHHEKRHDEPVEYLRGGPVLQVLGHEVFLRGLAESLGEVAKRKGA